MVEDLHQIALFDWMQMQLHVMPELAMAFHTPNGGSRHIAEAAKLKRMGVKSGVPDVFLPVPSGKYHGLFIELKSEVGSTSRQQKDWLQRLSSNGYRAVVCKGWVAARDEIVSYLGTK